MKDILVLASAAYIAYRGEKRIYYDTYVLIHINIQALPRFLMTVTSSSGSRVSSEKGAKCRSLSQSTGDYGTTTLGPSF